MVGFMDRRQGRLERRGLTDEELPEACSSQDSVSGSANIQVAPSEEASEDWMRNLGVDLPRPVDSMFDNVATKTADPDVESVASDADLATVFTHAASVVLSADSAEALVVEPVVAEADGDDARPRLRPMYVPRSLLRGQSLALILHES